MKKIFFGLVVLFLLIALTSSVSAQTNAEIMTEIQNLKGQISSLISTMGFLKSELLLSSDKEEVKGATTCSFSRSLSLNGNNTGSDVQCLEEYLAAEGYFSATPDRSFTRKTKQAVSAWQVANSVSQTGGFFGSPSIAAYEQLVASGGSGGNDGNSQPEETNVALGKTVTVDSVLSDYVGPNAVDGVTSGNASRWVSTNSTAKHWIEIDLGGTYTISKINTYFGYDGYNQAPSQYKIMTWNGSSWDTQVSKMDNSDAVQEDAVADISTNKVRWETDLNDYVRMYEIEIFGYEVSGGSDGGNGDNSGDEPDVSDDACPSRICSFTRNLSKKKQSEGDDVKCLQEYLICGGHLAPGNDVGVFGRKTKKAANSWQYEQGLLTRIEYENTRGGFWGRTSRAKYDEIMGLSSGGDDGSSDGGGGNDGTAGLGTVNVASGKTVAVDSTYSNYVGENAVDGNVTGNNTRWLSSNTNSKHWIEVDLGETYTINKFKTYFGYDGYNQSPNQYKIMTWNGSSWDTQVNIIDNNSPTPENTIGGVTTNKIRWETDVDGYVRMYEIEVFGYVAGGSSDDVCEFTRNLSKRKRSTGPDVRCLQRYLIANNHLASGNATGFFGALTKSAAASWQLANSLITQSEYNQGKGGFWGALSIAKYNDLERPDYVPTADTVPDYSQVVIAGGTIWDYSLTGGTGSYYVDLEILDRYFAFDRYCNPDGTGLGPYAGGHCPYSNDTENIPNGMSDALREAEVTVFLNGVNVGSGRTTNSGDIRFRANIGERYRIRIWHPDYELGIFEGVIGESNFSREAMQELYRDGAVGQVKDADIIYIEMRPGNPGPRPNQDRDVYGYGVIGVRSQCDDGLDNDRNGKVDYPEDNSCNGISDNSESNINRANGVFAELIFQDRFYAYDRFGPNGPYEPEMDCRSVTNFDVEYDVYVNGSEIGTWETVGRAAYAFFTARKGDNFRIVARPKNEGYGSAEFTGTLGEADYSLMEMRKLCVDGKEKMIMDFDEEENDQYLYIEMSKPWDWNDSPYR